MNIESQKQEIGNLEIYIIKKDIKNIHLGVYPPKGRIRVAVPLNTSDEAIRLFIISKIPWIKKQKIKFIKQERQSEREFVSGESHYFLGNRYLLNVIQSDSKSRVEIRRKKHLDLYVKRGWNKKQKEKLLNIFYREELKKTIPKFLEKWQKKMDIEVKEARIKKMKTKWGSSNPQESRIWINLELAKKPIYCLEYVIVHEMVHFLERTHNKNFLKLIDSYMPKWKEYKSELNHLILGYSRWDYQ